MKLVGMFLFVLVAATVVVDVSASKASAECEKKHGFYYGPDSKGKMKCIKACDAVKNEVVLFGQTFLNLFITDFFLVYKINLYD